ncbi:long chain fatty alcohol oxidase [Meredithblackwellia eburnea MCA 4105]
MPTFTPAQLEVLKAIADTVVQGHDGAAHAELLASLPEDAPVWQKDKVDAFIRTKFSDFPGAIEALDEQFSLSLSPTNLDSIRMTLSLLSTRAGTLLLTGHPTTFPDLTLEQREKVLQSWASSRLLLLRKAYRGFAGLALFIAYTAVDSNGLSVGYPAAGDPLREQGKARVKSHHPFEFETISRQFQVIETDVLVIGSGAGGGVVSSELSKKGWKTLVVEKGGYERPEDLKGNPKEGLKTLYESSGLFATECGSLNILAGSTFGGGTTVNWSASLNLQHFAREEWGKVHGLSHFLSKEYIQSIDFVRNRMGVSKDHVKHNSPNQHLIDGAARLGYHVDTIPQNTGGSTHSCGFCSFGCVYGEKQGGTVSWLGDAARNGTRFLINTSVERLLFAATQTAPTPTEATLDKFTPTSSRTVCIGALVRTEDGKLAILRAREAVVVSAGSINSPAVLLRSGLKNKRIGKNLRLHPCAFITGYYKEKINPWDGSIMTAVSTVRENRDGTHHGVKLEVNMSFPGGSAAAYLPWTSSKEHKKSMLQYNHAFTLLSLCRDRGSGQVILDANGRPRLEYSLDPYDGISMLKGVIAGCEIHFAAGAKRISTSQATVEDYFVPEDGSGYLNDPKWKEWIAEVERVGIHPSWGGMGSAHQMGSCQMGTSASASVVDPRGRVWGTDRLYVADASVFPTASGVNPMITIMSVAHSISQFIDEDLILSAGGHASARL